MYLLLCIMVAAVAGGSWCASGCAGLTPLAVHDDEHINAAYGCKSAHECKEISQFHILTFVSCSILD